jgi:hypothetical protein
MSQYTPMFLLIWLPKFQWKRTYKFTPMFLLIWDITSKVRTEKNLHIKEWRQYVEVYQKLKYQQEWRLASEVGRKAHITLMCTKNMSINFEDELQELILSNIWTPQSHQIENIESQFAKLKNILIWEVHCMTT